MGKEPIEEKQHRNEIYDNEQNRKYNLRENPKMKPVATIMKRLKKWLGRVSQMNGKILTWKLYEIR